MHLLITRPYKQALETQKLLLSLNCQASIEPVLQLQKIPFSPTIYQNSKGFIVTSVHASRQLAQHPSLSQDIPIYAVGPATAKPLKEAGFTQVHEGLGDAKSLLALIRKKRQTHEGLLTYLSGWHITEDMAQVLNQAGYKAQRVICYRANPVDALSQKTVQLIQESQFDAVLFYSYRSADIFCSLIQAENLETFLKSMTAIALSEYICSALEQAKWGEIIFSETPSQDGLLAKVKALKSRQHPPIF